MGNSRVIIDIVEDSDNSFKKVKPLLSDRSTDTPAFDPIEPILHAES